MSTHERFEVEPSAPPPPPGRSTASKILLGCGLGCGVILVLCCGAAVAVMWWGARVLPRSVERDPAAIRTVTAEIATIDIPDGLKPEAALDLKMPFTGQPILMAAVYKGTEDEELLALADFAGPEGSVDQKQLRTTINEALSGQGSRAHEEDFKVEGEPRELDLEIRGQPAKFRIEEGEIKSGRKMIRAMGQFHGHRGTALLFLQLDAENHDAEQVEQLLRSIQ